MTTEPDALVIERFARHLIHNDPTGTLTGDTVEKVVATITGRAAVMKVDRIQAAFTLMDQLGVDRISEKAIPGVAEAVKPAAKAVKKQKAGLTVEEAQAIKDKAEAGLKEPEKKFTLVLRDPPEHVEQDADEALMNLPDERAGTNIVAAARNMRQILDETKRSVLTKRDISVIQGKPWINRSGWMLIGGTLHVTDEIVSRERSVDEKGVITWLFVVRASIPALDGESMPRSCVGVGMCKSNEKGGKEEHAVVATAHTRAKCRAISDIVGAGIASADEVG
jgi:hypothetical protein